MTPDQPIRPVVFFLDGYATKLHATYFPPTGPRHAVGSVLFVPPFAEELNRCRAMVAIQARAFSQIGIGTLILDLRGTGDSEGDFVDATWESWRGDLQRGVHWLRSQAGGCTTLWALRLGAVLASQVARDVGAIERLLLWQPVMDSKQAFTQFLRIRIAAEMGLADRVKTTGELRDRSAQGESIEVSGYRLGPALVRALDETNFDSSAISGAVRLDWIEVLARKEDELAPVTQKRMEAMRQAGASVLPGSVVGPAFWQVHEREVAPMLIQETTARALTWTSGKQAPGQSVQFAAPDNRTGAEMPMGFVCGTDYLIGVLHKGADDATVGVVIVVAGGPQYRVGAHRQFVTMARRLASAGSPVLRFDLRGMGDSTGEHLGYQHAEVDIRSAVDSLMMNQPQLRQVVLLGECESASGILFYAWKDPRISGTVLINPWVRTDEGRAQVIVRHYYMQRLFSAEFWNHVLRGHFKARESLGSLWAVMGDFFRGRLRMARQRAQPQLDDISDLPLPVRVAEGLRRFRGRSLLLMSGFDYIAREFDEVTRTSKAWAGLLDSERLRRVDIANADHTFSREIWKFAAADAVSLWLKEHTHAADSAFTKQTAQS